MLTAEQRYYVDNFEELDSKRKRQSKRSSKNVAKPQTSKGVFTKQDRAKLFVLMLIIGILCIAGVVTTAYATQVKYNINQVSKENAVIQGEIDNLNVIIEGANNVKNIEDKAINQLGMIYPSYEQIVYISQNSEKSNNFALVLREQAYN